MTIRERLMVIVRLLGGVVDTNDDRIPGLINQIRKMVEELVNFSEWTGGSY